MSMVIAQCVTMWSQNISSLNYIKYPKSFMSNHSFPMIYQESVKAEDAKGAPTTYVVPAGKPATLVVNLERVADSEELSPVVAPYFPRRKDEQWWLVIGKPSTNALLAIKRITVNK